MGTFLIVLIIYLIMWGICGCLFANMSGFEVGEEEWGFRVFCGVFWPVLAPALLMYYILNKDSK